MRTKDEIIRSHYVCNCDILYKSRGKIDPACVLHEQGGEIELIMDEYAKEVAIDFINWTAEGECSYSMTDEDQWTHQESRENITTKELFQLYIKQKQS